jgi:hypothetical protein
MSTQYDSIRSATVEPRRASVASQRDSEAFRRSSIASKLSLIVLKNGCWSACSSLLE